MSQLTFQKCIIVAVFISISIWTKAVVNASLCQVIYNKGDEQIHCLETEDSIIDFNSSFLVLKYKCKNGDNVYEEYCPERTKPYWAFELNNCALTPDTLNFCSTYSIFSFFAPYGYHKNVVLQNGTFENRHAVKIILLRKTGIHKIESDAFGCLKELMLLDLSQNDIEDIPHDAFSCLNNLLKLNLSSNRIMILPESLGSLRSLKYLDLSSNFVVTFPQIYLHKETRLSYMNLEMNKIEEFCPSEFMQLDNVDFLSLRGNNIKYLDYECYSKLSKLIFLDIGMNTDLKLTNDSFLGLHQLHELYIDGCGLTISFEESGAFSNTPLLKKLHFNHNRLQEINAELFKELRELTHLNLSFNAIDVLHNESFANNGQLLSLDLSNNLLSEMKTSDVSNLSHLQHLDLSYNRISHLSQDIFDNLTSIVTLNISNNFMIYEPQYVFPKLKHLNTLSMSNSTFSNFQITFPEENSNIRYLDISFNSRVQLSENSLKNLKYLTTINLQGVNIESLSYLSRESLEEINLSKNKIREIDNYSLRKLNKLQKLDLSWNKIATISPYAFKSCLRLEYLNLSHNNLHHSLEPALFEKSKHLKVLDVSFNNLAWMSSYHLSGFVETDIQAVHLENNKIRKVPIHFLFEKRSGIPTKRIRFFLSGNPINCDCNAFQLYNYFKQKDHYHSFSFEVVTCGQPSELHGKKVEDLLPYDFSCEVKESCPKKCRCLKRPHDSVTVVNCSRRNLDQLPEDVPTNTSVLLINNNRITSLESLKNSIWENLTDIHAEENFISSPDFYVPKNVKVFLLHGNKLTKLPESLQRHIKAYRGETRITLSDNPWSCGCESLPLKHFLSNYAVQVPDAFQVRCFSPNTNNSNITLLEMKEEDICYFNRNKVLSFLIALTVVLSVLMLGILLRLYYTRNKYFVNAILYTHCNFLYRIMRFRKIIKEDKIFDCFLSYGSEDKEVALAILKVLREKSELKFKFCVHDRHVEGGMATSDDVFTAVDDSRKTLIIISKTFAKTKLFQTEFQAAIMQMLKDKQDRIIFVLKGDLPDSEDQPHDVKKYLATSTYLVWEEKWFFEKLIYLLQKESLILRERHSFKDLLRNFFFNIGKYFRNNNGYCAPREEVFVPLDSFSIAEA